MISFHQSYTIKPAKTKPYNNNNVHFAPLPSSHVDCHRGISSVRERTMADATKKHWDCCYAHATSSQ